ncbi:50S ribosomal protein L18 [uncultured archaeon]|nr:50S ribosomal protein L18 [uncultured archaeon]
MSKATGPIFLVHFRRRREGKTDYVKRLALVKSGRTRLIVRKSNRNMIIQFIDWNPKGDVTKVHVESLKIKGLAPVVNTQTAYITGFIAGKKAMEKGIKDFILDLGLNKSSKANVLYAAVKGVLDSGLKGTVGEEMLPEKARLEGQHLKKKISIQEFVK